MTYVCSDIHGNYERYRALLEKLRLGPADTLYVLGDVIDRGPEGLRVLGDMMLRPNIVALLGNHEFMAAMCIPWLLEEITDESLSRLDAAHLGALSDWMANGGGPTIQALRRLPQEDRTELLEYIRDMELYAEVEAGGRSFLLVHAGLERFDSEKPLEDYELEDFLYGRPEPGQTYFPDRTVIFGHTPTREFSGQDRVFSWENMIDIDCGCGFGGPLACLCLETMEEFYV